MKPPTKKIQKKKKLEFILASHLSWNEKLKVKGREWEGSRKNRCNCQVYWGGNF